MLFPSVAKGSAEKAYSDTKPCKSKLVCFLKLLISIDVLPQALSLHLLQSCEICCDHVIRWEGLVAVVIVQRHHWLSLQLQRTQGTNGMAMFTCVTSLPVRVA